MGFFGKQFLDILEWEDRGQEILVYKYPMEDNEIQNGGKLVVRPGQSAVFVNEGKIADVFLEPGTYTLTTQTLPILTNLKNWSYGFKSPFKSDVYFVSTRQFLDQKWGTPQPILIPDPKFEQVEIKAFGTFAFRVMDPALLLMDVTSTNKVYTVEDIRGQLRSYIISNFARIVAAQNVSIAQLVQNYQIIDAAVLEAVNKEFEKLGLEIVSFTTQNISLQQELLEALRKRSSVSILGDLGTYSQVQMIDAMKESVKNPGVNAMTQAGIGMGVGMGMAGMMAQGMQQGAAAGKGQQPAQTPPPQQPQGGIACPQCGHVAPGDAAFCSKCGTKIEAVPAAKFCTKCGAQNGADAAFCAKCGNKLV
jgi:membrane protease subunit (stomatin/prohibitin family)